MPVDLTGQTVAGYPLERLVARDSYGEFYEARTSAEPIIVKVLSEPLRADPSIVHAVADGWQKAHTVVHPNLLAVLGAGLDPRYGAYALQESLHTRSLRQLVLDGVCLNWRDLLEFAIQMTSALKALHEAGMTHGDLSPFHVLTTFDGEVRIEGSGGLSRVTRAWAQWMPVQALAYFAPERLRGGESSAAADLYSLGACLYFAIAGHDPFSGHDAEAVVKAVSEVVPAPPRQRRGDVPPDGLAVLAVLLEKDPLRRYSSVGDLLEDLVALKEGRPWRPLRHSGARVEEGASAERSAPPAEVRTSAPAAIRDLPTQVDSTVPRSEREKDGDYFYRTGRPVLAQTYWQEAWNAGARHPGLKLKLELLQPEVRRASFETLMGEARLAFATGAFKAAQKCAHQALEFADDEAGRKEAAQMETRAASQTGSFLGLNRSTTGVLLLIGLAGLVRLLPHTLP